MDIQGTSDFRGLGIALVVGVIGVAAAMTLPRLKTGAAGPEDAAVEKANELRARGDVDGALAALRECVARERRACRCVDAEVELSVDVGNYTDALPLVARPEECTSARHSGLRAEVLVGQGRVDQGLVEAQKAFIGDPEEPHACLAKALALSRSGSSPEALQYAEKAVKGGRGVPALLLLAALRIKGGDLAGAQDATAQAARLVPSEARAAFERGVAEQAKHHYREAREAYLRALALDPRMADARYNLAVLTHSVKADDEARHHLDELGAIAPEDPRIAPLRAAIDKHGP